jgi:hypothetical protein
LEEAGRATDMGSTSSGSGGVVWSFLEDLEGLVFSFFLEEAASEAS